MSSVHCKHTSDLRWPPLWQSIHPPPPVVTATLQINPMSFSTRITRSCSQDFFERWKLNPWKKNTCVIFKSCSVNDIKNTVWKWSIVKEPNQNQHVQDVYYFQLWGVSFKLGHILLHNSWEESSPETLRKNSTKCYQLAHRTGTLCKTNRSPLKKW